MKSQTSIIPFFVHSPGSLANRYHRIADKHGDRYMTRCDILLTRWQVTYYPPDGMEYCPKCAKMVRNPFVSKS